jgi:hypothetical protein
MRSAGGHARARPRGAARRPDYRSNAECGGTERRREAVVRSGGRKLRRRRYPDLSRNGDRDDGECNDAPGSYGRDAATTAGAGAGALMSSPRMLIWAVMRCVHLGAVGGGVAVTSREQYAIMDGAGTERVRIQRRDGEPHCR